MRMRLRKKSWAKPELEKDPRAILNPWEQKGKWQELFANDHPIHLELGCGRGRFISQLAGRHSEINYLALDLYDELLVQVLRKVNENCLNNLRVIPVNAQNLGDIFARDEIEGIYINFCNPWPNKRHHKRRLTHPGFLRLYQSFLRNEGEIRFKTDNELLFHDSLEYFRAAGYQELYRTYDLQQSDFQGNIMTEYEEKFCRQGIKIKFAIFRTAKTIRPITN